MIEQALNVIHIEREVKQQQLHVECPDNLQGGRGDAVQLTRALANLLGNAVKYTPEGGRITVRAFKEVANPGSRVVIEVEDTGIGIAEEHLYAIFDPFYRVQQPGTGPIDEDVPGIGLGLSVVKSAVEYHHGKVFVRSTPGQGSVFGFWIPC